MTAQQMGHLWRDSEHTSQVTRCPQGMKTIPMSLSMHTLQSFSRCSFSSFFKGSSAKRHKKWLLWFPAWVDVTSERTEVTELTLSSLKHTRITIKHTTVHVTNEIVHIGIAFAGLTDPFQNGPFHHSRLIAHVDSFLADRWLQYIWWHWRKRQNKMRGQKSLPNSHHMGKLCGKCQHNTFYTFQ